MNTVHTAQDFEQYKLTVKKQNGQTVQLVNSVNGSYWRPWTRKRRLGKGGFGEVFLEEAANSREELQYRAVKTCSLEKMYNNDIDYKRELAALAAFSKVDHASWFVNLHGWWEEPESLYVAMEYMRLGSLFDYASKGIPEDDIKEIATNILNGLKVMHAEGFAHRDIKPENILVYRKRPDHPQWWVKISDFGLSKQVTAESHTALRTAVGTRSYRAPETRRFLDPHQDDSSYTTQVDMWSFGCLLFHLGSHGNLPFDDDELIRYCYGKTTFNPQNYTLRLSDGGIWLIEDLLRPDPRQRLTASDALQDPWLTAPRASAQGNGVYLPPTMQPDRSQNFNSALNSNPELTRVRRSPQYTAAIPATGSVEQDLVQGMTMLSTSPYRPQYTAAIPAFGGVEQDFDQGMTMIGTSPYSSNQGSQTAFVPGNSARRFRSRSQEPRAPGNWGASNLTSHTVRPNSHSPFQPEYGPNTYLNEQSAYLDSDYEPSTVRPNSHSPFQPEYGANTYHNEQSAYLDSDYEPSTVRPNSHSPFQPEYGTNTYLNEQSAYLDSDFEPSQNDYDELEIWRRTNSKELSKGRETGQGELALAADQGKIKIMNMLVRLGAEVDALDNRGRTPIHRASYNGQREAVEWLKYHGADIRRKSITGHTALHYATQGGHVDVIIWLYEQGLDIDARTRDGGTPLHAAALAGHLEALKFLVEQHAFVDATNANGTTPLHFAARWGRFQIVKWLVRQGALVNPMDNYGLTPRKRAKEGGYTAVEAWLRDQEAMLYSGSEEKGTSSAASKLKKLFFSKSG